MHLLAVYQQCFSIGSRNELIERWIVETIMIRRTKIYVSASDWEQRTSYSRRRYTKFVLGPFSVLKRCMYGRQVHEYVLEYITSFWEVYRDMPKVFSAHFSEAHESTGEVIANMDRDLGNLNFLGAVKNFILIHYQLQKIRSIGFRCAWIKFFCSGPCMYIQELSLFKL